MRISDWSSDVCSSDLTMRRHWPTGLLPRNGGAAVKRGTELRNLPARGLRNYKQVACHCGPVRLPRLCARLPLRRAGGCVLQQQFKSAERRVGKKCGRQCRLRVGTENKKQKKIQ